MSTAEIAPAQTAHTDVSQEVASPPSSNGKERLPCSNEEYFFPEIQEEAYAIWQANGHTAEACWEEAKRQVTKRGFQPKAVATINVVPETQKSTSE